MRLRPIGELTEKISTWNPERSDSVDDFTYIDLSSIDQLNKKIANPQLVSSKSAPSRARQLVRGGDILVSTVRPNLNGVAAVPSALDGATASTGFTVLRSTEELESAYLYHWVRSPLFISEMTRQATGQSYPAVSDRIVKGSLIPTPSVSEQRRIARVLDTVDALRARRREALSLLDDLAQSIFLEMFGDPARNPNEWPMRKIADLISSASYGTSEKASEAGDIPVLRMGNITASGQIDLGDLKFMDRARVPEKHLVRRGDILFNRTNSAELVGKSAIYRGSGELAYAGYLVRVRMNEANDPEYLAAFLNARYTKRVLRGMCKSIVGMANINARELQDIDIAEPPLDLQIEFAKRIWAIESLRGVHWRHLAELDALFVSLQSRAFRGELWQGSAMSVA
ncbi:hypothetical protein CG717_02650 [Streptomyces sp. CB02613]|uniref:restriction endonuclease subunit S n=1 Tax=Streptomyces sp. CB02613 TaxID=2020328 RepID=UPI000C26F823|nr:restriction endonuclease subunit S [Streptomyces sp. CB02613]PJN35156.1 hypothetical protein CG717_02650 [Streptomyces sp. CB02613]